MSRSYKKNPVMKESSTNRSSAKSGKRIASRIVRHHKDIPDGGAYRKFYCSWCICDYRFRMTETDFRKTWEDPHAPLSVYLHRHFRTYQQALLWWKKFYRNK